MAEPARSAERGARWGVHRAAVLAAAAPVIVFALVMARLSFNAPVWDDYTTIIESTTRLVEAGGPVAAAREILAQHNEHRIAVTRLVNVVSLAVFGEIDFRFISFVGHLFLAGIFALFVREFRERVPGTAYLAAALLLFQLSYWQSSLLAMGTSGNFGVVFFAFLCLAYANGDDRRSLAVCLAAGVAAALTQANGLAALPIAAAWHFLTRRHQSGAVIAGVFLFVTAAYFRGYVHPAHHPSAALAFGRPFATLAQFLINLGGVVPGVWLPAVVGAWVGAGVAWAVAGRIRREHPVVILWMAFVVASLASAAAGRIGFGIAHSSRYALNASVLLCLLLLGLWSTVVKRDRQAGYFLAAVAFAASVAIYAMSWPAAVELSRKGKMLAEVRPVSEAVKVPRFVGIQFTEIPIAHAWLARSVDRGLYRVPTTHLAFETAVTTERTLPRTERIFGIVDAVEVKDRKVTLTGWTDIGADIPGRSMHVASAERPTSATAARIVPREDVGILLGRPEGILGGFHVELEYGSAEAAQAAASTACLAIRAPNRPDTLVWRPGVDCGARAGS